MPPDPLILRVEPGGSRVTAEPHAVLTTNLGSCVAFCVRDRISGAGGLAHYVLPRAPRRTAAAKPGEYGEFAVPALLDALARLDALHENLEIKLFGGACMPGKSRQFGLSNADFAEDYARTIGIVPAATRLRGHAAIDLRFEPATGRVRLREIPLLPALV